MLSSTILNHITFKVDYIIKMRSWSQRQLEPAFDYVTAWWEDVDIFQKKTNCYGFTKFFSPKIEYIYVAQISGRHKSFRWCLPTYQYRFVFLTVTDAIYFWVYLFKLTANSIKVKSRIYQRDNKNFSTKMENKCTIMYNWFVRVLFHTKTLKIFFG